LGAPPQSHVPRRPGAPGDGSGSATPPTDVAERAQSPARVHHAPAPGPALDHALDFEGVYERHFPFVWRSLRALGVREDSAEDAAQDVFLVVHRRLGEFEGRAKVTTWLFAICRRVASEYHRRRNKASISSDESADSLPDCPGKSPLLSVESSQAARALERFLESLEPGQRDAFFLMCVEELSAPEAAEILDVKLNTVYSRLRLAKQKFERYVARMSQEPVP
jgi:RNA polymerase sigma-70 factor, ECF subfamily